MAGALESLYTIPRVVSAGAWQGLRGFNARTPENKYLHSTLAPCAPAPFSPAPLLPDVLFFPSPGGGNGPTMRCMEIKEAVIQVDVQPLQTYQVGDGPPVVLFHGGGVDSARLTWGAALPALASRYHVYLADWPGYGGSPLGDEVQSVDYLVQLAKGLIDAWGLDRPAVGGLSLGGGVALGLTLTHPQAVRALALVDSYGLQDRVTAHTLSYLSIKPRSLWSLYYRYAAGDRKRTQTLLGAIFHDKSAITDDLVDEAYAAVRQPGAGMAFYSTQRDELLSGGLKTCYMDRLGEISVPTLIVHGADDTAVPLRYAQEAAARIPHSRLVVIPDAGHWPPRERPEAFNDALLAFLDSLDGDSRADEKP